MKLSALVVTAVLLLGLTACGGGGGPSKASYIAQADKICRGARVAALPLVKQLTAGVSLTPAQARRRAGIAARLHAVEARYLAQLRAVRQPSGDKDAINAFLTPAGQVVDAIGSAARSLAHGDVATTFGRLTQAQSTGGEAKNAADAYGFKECGAALGLVT